ncbi:A-kinase anchor protein 9 isoform X16 [Manis pentadactyla]|uniref:A-kinase anchor protein 9 isoform X16 n=1 Tax=Manis pentadactyla TaxID=143292 RepID=UPI00255C49A1|nr:A-kinase anchor protein 9 isoform X16 [Manis pentadactyla]
MEDEERLKKLEAGKAKLAQFRQRKAQSDGQNPSKKQKKKRKTSSSKHDSSAYHALNIEQSQSDETCINSSQRVGSTMTPESTTMRTLHSGEISKHDQVFSIEPESEISTTADDYSSEVNGCSFVVRTGKPTNLLREEEFCVDDFYSEHGAQYNQTHLEMMENELAGKQHEIEELNRELEEMRATYGTEGLQQLQEFEAAIKQRDGIITQLTANLQQARREKAETMREFLELTEQSQKLQIQFQHLQASETLRNSTHSSTAADLLQAKQQILTHQQQLEEQDHLLEDYQKKKEDFKVQINILQEKIRACEMEQDKKVESSNKEVQEKEAIIEELNTKIIEEEKKTLELKDKVTAADKLLEELQEQVVQKNQEINNVKLELTNSKQKERQCSEEIKQLMGTVEELQKKNHKDSQSETDILQRMEQETQRKLGQLQAELDEMYGQQIVQMKQELIKQHMSQIDELKTRHKEEVEIALRSFPNITINEDQIKLMNVAINELNIKLQDTNSQKEKLKEELGAISGEKSVLQRKLEDLFEELSFSRDQIQRARQTIVEQESKLNEAHESLNIVEDLKTEIVSASESRKELELKHEAEVTNYKIKLEMLEREKNAVLDRMAESQEAELERLRTQLLFSHEEELSKLKEDLEIEHQINIEKLKDNLGIHYKQQMDGLQSEMSQKIETMQFEKDNLISKQNQLILEISELKDLQQSLVNSKSEEMTLQINELQKEIEILRKEEKEKGTLEQEVQELQLKTELLEKQMKEKEDDLQEKFAQLEAENSILKNEKRALEDMLKIYTPDSIKSKSKDYSWQQEVEILTEENEDLKKQCIQLTEEIEKQRNTFSFAEKNFEVNYQELQEDYACLLKLPSVTNESSLGTTELNEDDKFQRELSILKSEQHDLRLQLEAQRICLSLVYSTHVDQVREYMENEKDKALCSLKEELISAHEEKIKELQKIHQLELQNIKAQEAVPLGDEMKPLQMLIGRLRKAVSEECSYFTQSSYNVLGEHTTSALNCEVNGEERECCGVHTSENQELQDCRYEVQEFQENMQTLLNKVTEECNKLLVLQTRLSKFQGQQTDTVKLEFAEENLPKEETGFLPAHSQITCLEDTDVSHKSKLSTQQDIEKIKKLEGQVQELENLISALQQQLKETEENYGAEIHCLEERLQAVSESTVQPSFSIDSLIITESDVRKTVYPGSCLKQNIDGTIEFVGEYGVKEETNMVKLLEKQYQERLEEEVAKVIVSMSIAFAQQTERSRISGEKEDTVSSKQAHAVCQQEHYLDEMKLSQGQLGFHTFEATDMGFKEEFKPLSKELGEGEKKVLLSNSDNLGNIPESEDHELTISEEMFSKDNTFIVTESIHNEILVSSVDASRQLMLNEEQLEDMRQELVRQYQEHQQATELLRQAHMRQMERQREDQEQLQEEIERLNRQLAQRSSIDNENLVSERERVLLEELEALKQLSVAGREKLCCELRSSSTQTQSGHENQGEIEEQTFKEKELDRKPEDVSPDILSNESLHGGIWPLRFWLPHWIISMEHSQYGTQTRKTVYALQKANNKLLKILLEVVKTTAAVEETIGRHVLGILDRSSKGQSSASLIWRSEAEAPVKSRVLEEHTGVTDESIPSYSGSDMPRNDSSMWPKVPEEGTDLSKRLIRSGFAGTEIDPENEEFMLNISCRLQAAVEKLLEAISETSSQLEHAKVTQTELMRESFRQKQEVAESLKGQEELRERLHEESRAREQLAVELSKAEGVIDGYADEKTFFERQIQEKTDIIDHLQQELLCAGNRLQELEAEQQQIQEERELLSRQKEAMKAEAGPVEQRLVDAAVDAAPGAEFLQETEKLMKEKLEVQCQAEKVCDDLQKQVKALEIDVEEQVSRFIELEQAKNAELMDLRQQNQALEKQLEKMRKFLDEQAIDREHERDVFQQEIQKLEYQLKVIPRFQPISEHQTREVEQLTNHLKEKTDKCSELLLSKEQLQRDIQERNEEIEKLEFRVRELEQALLVSTDTFQKVEDQKQFGAVETKAELSLEVQLQAERDAIDRKEKEITNLEEQLEQFREELENKNEEVQQLHMQLEIQKKESTTRLQELEQENKLFKDEMEKLGFAIKESDAISTEDQHVLFGKIAQIIQEKEVEIDQLNEQITKLQYQLKITTDNKIIEGKNERIKDLETQIECLMSDQERVKRNREEETEQLNEVIEKLQQELANIEQKTPVDANALPEEADSLRNRLDMVICEKLALEQQVESTNEEIAFMKNVLKETNFKMNQLTQELSSLRRKRENTEKTQSVPEKNVSMAIDDLSKSTPKLGVVLTEDAPKPLENQIYLKSFEENSKVSISSLETKVLQLEGTVSAKDLELTQCYEQIKEMQEQGQSEAEVLKKRVVNLQNILEEKVAAALVSQVQLEAIKEYVKFCENKQAISSEPERTNIQNLNQLAENEMVSDISALTSRISELESQVVEMQMSLNLEKEHVETAEKNALEKEKELLELQKLLEDEVKQGGKDRKKCPQEDFEVLKTTMELIHTNEESEIFGQLEALRAESAVTKEELASFKEKAEKLQEELLIKETNTAFLQKDLTQVRDQLTEAEERLSYFLKKEVKTEIQDNRKVCILEPLPIKVGKSSASQTEGTLKGNSSSQTPQVLVRNAGIQIDLQSECSSEEVTELISQFTEKIEQMQELHAAEILDMESRHISETETLKREHYVAVQLLTEECGTLKAVIQQCLRSKEGSSVPELTHSDAYQTREVCSSDSGSDWGQGIYLTQSQGFDTASEGQGEEGESSTDLFPKKIKGLLRAVHNEGMQVLSLTESPYDDGEDHSIQQLSGSWLEERRAYLSTISSLKDLITKMQVQREAEIYDSSQAPESFSDWRGELLLALQQVFLKEHSVLLAAFQTELTALGTRDAVGLLNCLEQRIQEQSIEYQAAMEYLQKADRRSLLSEIQALHAQMNGRKMTLKTEQENDQPSQELLEYNMQQKQSQILEMQVELSSAKDRATELQEHLSSEKMVAAELKSELAQTKLELETTLKAQHKHLKELETFRLEVKDKTDEVHLLNDTLASEQKKYRELQWALEKEKAKLGRSEERDRAELEDLKFSLEGQKQRNIQLNLLLEQQKQLLNESQQKIESQRVLHDAQLSEERGRNLELQVLLESEKVRIQEMSSTLDRERELHAQLQSSDNSGHPQPSLPSEDLLKELQKQLEEKHSRIVELLNETEKYKLDSLQTRQQMEKDRQVHRKTLQTEQEANTEGQKKMHELQSKVEDLQRQLEEKRQQVYKLDLEGKRLQGIMQEFEKQELEREEKRERRILYQNLNEPATWNLTNDRTRNWVLQQKIEEETKETSYPKLIEMNGGGNGFNHELEMIRQKLQCVASKLQHIAQKASNRLQFETADDEDFIWVQENINGIILQLQKLTGQPAEEPSLVFPSTSCGSLTERLLRQNAELTGHISQLTEEKNDLRNMVMKLEEQIRWYRQTRAGRDYSSRYSFSGGANIEDIIASEKQVWNREKLTLQKSLKRAEAEVCKLKAELRNEALLQNLSPDAEHATIKRIYGKYLRAESFRKALIYQKKYLLLLLGGFQECEDATLALLARMGGQPAFTDLEGITNRPKGFTRFRSAVRVSVAISRMKFLVRRWHRVTSSGPININRDGFGLSPGAEKTDPFYHSSGGLELYGEPRHTTYRSRSDLDYPRSPLPFQNRYPGPPADLNPGSLACSQLQNYDPDRALTDYITRLEALQRRLGTVQSGSAQFHAGMRR